MRLAVSRHLLKHLAQSADLRADTDFQAAKLHRQLDAHIRRFRLFDTRLLFRQLFRQLIDLFIFIGNYLIFRFRRFAAFAQGDAQFAHRHSVYIVQGHAVDFFPFGQTHQRNVFFDQEFQ